MSVDRTDLAHCCIHSRESLTRQVAAARANRSLRSGIFSGADQRDYFSKVSINVQ